MKLLEARKFEDWLQFGDGKLGLPTSNWNW